MVARIGGKDKYFSPNSQIFQQKNICISTQCTCCQEMGTKPDKYGFGLYKNPKTVLHKSSLVGLKEFSRFGVCKYSRRHIIYSRREY